MTTPTAPTVILRPGRRIFNVEIAGVRTDYDVVSEWEGMLKLTGPGGVLIVARKDLGTLSRFWRDAFAGITDDHGETAVVVMASPDIFDALRPKAAA